MGTLLSSTTMTGGSLVTASATLNDDGSINRESRNSFCKSTLVTTASVVAGTLISEYEIDKIYEKYSSAYMESTTNEELNAAKQKVDRYIAYLDSLSDEELANLLEEKNQLQILSDKNKEKTYKNI